MHLSLRQLGIPVLFVTCVCVPLRAADHSSEGHADVASAAPSSSMPTDATRAKLIQKYVRPTAIPFPSDNSYTKERELLGKTLFFDPRLSSSGATSCASCHNPGFGWSDGLPKGIGFGAKPLARHSPTILNAAWADLLFWDGRADSLESQALGPIASAAEMNLSVEELIKRVNSIPGYQPLFASAYPGAVVDASLIARAIATFERTVVSGQAPFDRWVAGDATAISVDAKRGFDVFNGKAHCSQCHSGWNFTDNGFHDIGVHSDDRGRGAKVPLEAMQFAFKTPTLRNADLRSPFMHDGSEQSLDCVIAFYDRGGDEKRPSLAPEITPLHLTGQEIKDLAAFLKTLNSPDNAVTIPILPH